MSRISSKDEWEKVVDQLSGQVYYHNKRTNEMKFEEPAYFSKSNSNDGFGNSGRNQGYSGSNTRQEQIDSDAALAAAIASEETKGNFSNTTSSSNIRPSNNLVSPNSQSQIDADAAFAASLAQEMSMQPSSNNNVNNTNASSPILLSRSEDLRPVLVNDNDFDSCPRCSRDFTVTHRRHHCKSCGSLLCANCLEDKGFVFGKMRKVCRSCFDILSEGQVHCLKRYFSLVNAFCKGIPVIISRIGFEKSRFDFKSLVGRNEMNEHVSLNMFEFALKGINIVFRIPINLLNSGNLSYDEQIILKLYIGALQEYTPLSFLEIFQYSSNFDLPIGIIDELLQLMGNLFEFSALCAANNVTNNRYTYAVLFSGAENNIFRQTLNRYYSKVSFSNQLKSSKFAVLKIFAMFGGYFEMQETFRLSGVLATAFDDLIDFTESQQQYALEVLSRNLAGNFKNVEILLKPKSAAVQKLLILAKSSHPEVQRLALKLLVSLTDFSIVGQAASKQAIDNLIFFNGVSDLQKVITTSSISSKSLPDAVKIINSVLRTNGSIVKNYFDISCLLPFFSTEINDSTSVLIFDVLTLMVEMSSSKECAAQFLSFSGIGIVVRFLNNLLKSLQSYENLFLKSLEIIRVTLATSDIPTLHQYVDDAAVTSTIELLRSIQSFNKARPIALQIMISCFGAGGKLLSTLFTSENLQLFAEAIQTSDDPTVDQYFVDTAFHLSRINALSDISSDIAPLMMQLLTDTLCIKSFGVNQQFKVLRVIEVLLIQDIGINPVALWTTKEILSFQDLKIKKSYIFFNELLPVLTSLVISNPEEINILITCTTLIILRFTFVQYSIESDADKCIKCLKDLMLSRFVIGAYEDEKILSRNSAISFLISSKHCSKLRQAEVQEGFVFLAVKVEEIFQCNEFDLLNMLFFFLHKNMISNLHLQDFLANRFMPILVEILLKVRVEVMHITCLCLSVLVEDNNSAVAFMHLGGVNALLEIVSQNIDISLKYDVLSLLALCIKSSNEVARISLESNPRVFEDRVELVRSENDRVRAIGLDIFGTLSRVAPNSFTKKTADVFLEIRKNDTFVGSLPEPESKVFGEIILNLAAGGESSIFSQNMVTDGDMSLIKDLLSSPKLPEKLRGLQIMNELDQSLYSSLDFSLPYILDMFSSGERSERLNTDIFHRIDDCSIRFLTSLLESRYEQVFSIHGVMNMNQMKFDSKQMLLALENQVVSVASESSSLYGFLSHPEFQKILHEKLIELGEEGLACSKLLCLVHLLSRCFGVVLNNEEHVSTKFIRTILINLQRALKKGTVYEVQVLSLLATFYVVSIDEEGLCTLIFEFSKFWCSQNEFWENIIRVMYFAIEGISNVSTRELLAVLELTKKYLETGTGKRIVDVLELHKITFDLFKGTTLGAWESIFVDTYVLIVDGLRDDDSNEFLFLLCDVYLKSNYLVDSVQRSSQLTGALISLLSCKSNDFDLVVQLKSYDQVEDILKEFVHFHRGRRFVVKYFLDEIREKFVDISNLSKARLEMDLKILVHCIYVIDKENNKNLVEVCRGLYKNIHTLRVNPQLLKNFCKAFILRNLFTEEVTSATIQQLASDLRKTMPPDYLIITLTKLKYLLQVHSFSVDVEEILEKLVLVLPYSKKKCAPEIIGLVIEVLLQLFMLGLDALPLTVSHFTAIEDFISQALKESDISSMYFVQLNDLCDIIGIKQKNVSQTAQKHKTPPEQTFRKDISLKVQLTQNAS